MKRLLIGLLAALCLAVVWARPTQTQQPPSLVYGNNSGTIRPIAVDSLGNLMTLGYQKVTYSAATATKTATAAGVTPFLSICGSATKTLRIEEITISGTVATAAVYGDVRVQKTSTATSSGTPAALTATPYDSASAAATATVLNFYTALATAGTLVGTLAQESAVFPITATVAAAEALIDFNWFSRPEYQVPTLRGTAQCLEVSFGTTTTNAPTLSAQVIWTEE